MAQKFSSIFKNMFWKTPQIGEEKSYDYNVIDGLPYVPNYDNDLNFEKNIGHIYNCVDIISQSVSKNSYRVQNNKTKKIEENHPYHYLLSNPNRDEIESNFYYETTALRLLSGNVFIRKSFVGNLVYSLDILPTQDMRIVFQGGEISRYYMVDKKGDTLNYQPNEILWLRSPNPNKQEIYGSSVMEKAIFQSDEYDYMSKMSNKNLKNDAIPKLLLVSDKDINSTQATLAEKTWNEKYGGNTKNKNIAVMGAGLKPYPLSVSNKELEFLNSRVLNRSEIFGIFKVPESMAGYVVTGLNKSVAEQMYYNYIETAVRPILVSDAQFYTKDLRRLFKNSEHLEVIYDESKLAFNDKQHKLELHKSMFEMGVIDTSYLQEYYNFPIKSIEKLTKEPVNPKDEVKPKKSFDINIVIEKYSNQTYKSKIEKYLMKSEIRYTAKIESIFDSAVEKILRDQNIDKMAKFKSIETDELAKEINDLIKTISQLYFYNANNVKIFVIDYLDLPDGMELELKATYLGDVLESRRSLYKDSIAKTLQNDLANAFSEYKKTDQTLTEYLAKVEHIKFRNAARVARTETSIAFNASHNQVILDNDLGSKQWLSRRDDIVRKEHQLLDGQIVASNKEFSNGLQYPSEIGCRCVIRAVKKEV